MIVFKANEFLCVIPGEIFGTITSIADTWFSWTIPKFPVMSIEFRKADVVLDSANKFGLIKRAANILPGKFKCTSHCNITILGVEYIVLWELSSVSDVRADSGCTVAARQNSEEMEIENAVHTCSFKVLGTCHSTERQTILEEAYEYLHEYNRPVYVDLAIEPENIHDENAIAVFVQTVGAWHKVGYIASELTQYVSPCMDEPDFDVCVKHIKLRTTYRRIGFYITIDLSKKGSWHPNVVKASKSVM